VSVPAIFSWLALKGELNLKRQFFHCLTFFDMPQMVVSKLKKKLEKMLFNFSFKWYTCHLSIKGVLSTMAWRISSKKSFSWY